MKMKFIGPCVMAASVFMANPGIAGGVNSDDAEQIVNDATKGDFALSIWAGMHSWETVDLNDDGNLDFVGLVQKSKQKETNPTHILVVHGKSKEAKFKEFLTKNVIELDQGIPADSPESFVVETDKKILKRAQCSSNVAIKMVEEASTAFFLCYEKGMYQFTRDPNDTP